MTMSYNNMSFNKTKYILLLLVITGCLGFVYMKHWKDVFQENMKLQQQDPRLVHTEMAVDMVDEADSSHSSLKFLPVEMVPDLLNPGKFLKPKMTDAAMETAFNKWIEQIQVDCSDIRRLGHVGDGGWDVCFDPPFLMKSNNCLVYSFGIKKDWSFDDDISKNYGCQVHSFDPSIGKSDHKRSDLIAFHDLGLSGSLNGSGSISEPFFRSTSHRKWKMDTLNGITRTLGHQNKIIDYLKMDIEKSELFALPTMFQDGDFWMVKQFGLEVHTRNEYTPEKLGWIYLQLLQLELFGFRRFHYHANIHCKEISKATGNRITHCHEIYYINTNFIKGV